MVLAGQLCRDELLSALLGGSHCEEVNDQPTTYKLRSNKADALS